MNLLDRLVAIWKQEQPGEALPTPKETKMLLRLIGAANLPFAKVVNRPYDKP